ncbi:hypothetical protein CDEF62S_06022 [Castellaniella defragrans]
MPGGCRADGSGCNPARGGPAYHPRGGPWQVIPGWPWQIRPRPRREYGRASLRAGRPRVRQGGQRRAGALRDRQAHPLHDVAPAVPGAEVRELVGAQDPGVARALGEGEQGVQGVGGAGPLDLDRIHAQARVIGTGEAQHVQAVLRRGPQVAPLPGTGGRYQLDMVQRQGVEGCLRERNVGPVHRVEAAAQQPYALHWVV